MKEKELRNHAVCSNCEKKIGHTGLPFFWTCKVNRYGLDRRALQAQQGLTMMLGNAILANIMGPNEDLAKSIMDEVELTFCEDCMYDKLLNLYILVENVCKDKERENNASTE